MKKKKSEESEWVKNYWKNKPSHFGHRYAGFCDICLVHPCKCTEEDIEKWKKGNINQYKSEQ